MHYNPSLPLKLAGDASVYGVGAVISHVMEDGFPCLCVRKEVHPNHGPQALDHNPGPKQGIPTLAAAWLQRWALVLTAHSYDIEFRPTTRHGNADGLSRLPLRDATPEGVSSEPAVFNIAQLESLPVTSKQLHGATRTDKLLSKVLRFTREGWPKQVDQSLRPFWLHRDELTVERECLLWGIRAVIPEKLHPRVLEELHRDHPGISRMKSVARSYVWWPGVD